MLPEARKYRLSLILAHQYLEQIDEKSVVAVFGKRRDYYCVSSRSKGDFWV